MLPNLGIDLATVRGGGSCPSQFFGRTTDDRPIYIRYRGATLQVFTGPVGGRDSEAKDLLLEASIGPPLHGEILLEQVCDLCGITVHGHTPKLSQEKFEELSEHTRLFDFSGRTTTWSRELWLTPHTVAKLISDLKQEWLDLELLRIDWKKPDGSARLKRKFVLLKCKHPSWAAGGR